MHTTFNATLQTRMSTVEALDRLAQCRDERAWAAILEEHGVRILNLAQRITNDSALCDDVCQETLLQIRAHAGHFVPPAPPEDAEASARGWIMRIATCTAFKVMRMRRRASRREEVAAQRAPSIAPSAAEIVQMREQAEQVRREVAELPESLREALSLRFYGSLEYAELGAALGCSQDAAKKRVQRGLDVLRSRLAACGIAVSLGAAMSALGSGSASAAETAATGTVAGSQAVTGTFSGTQTVSQVLDPQRLAEWQGLLHSTHAPALSGVVAIGGLTIMAKKVLGAAAIILFLLAGAGAMQINALQSENAAAKAETAKMAESIKSLEKKLMERANDAGALHDQLAAREAEIEKLREKVADVEKKTNDAASRNVAFASRPDVSYRRIGGPDAPAVAWTTNPTTGKQGAGDSKTNVIVNGKKIELPEGAADVFVGQPQQFEIQVDPDTIQKRLQDLQANLNDLQAGGKNKEHSEQIKAAIEKALKEGGIGREIQIPNGTVQFHVIDGGNGITVQTQTRKDPKDQQPVKPPAPENTPNF